MMVLFVPFDDVAILSSLAFLFYIVVLTYDHAKVKHATRANAERQDARMKRIGSYDGSTRLNAYYNEDRTGWFVGKKATCSKKKKKKWHDSFRQDTLPDSPDGSARSFRRRGASSISSLVIHV